MTQDYRENCRLSDVVHSVVVACVCDQIKVCKQDGRGNSKSTKKHWVLWLARGEEMKKGVPSHVEEEALESSKDSWFYLLIVGQTFSLIQSWCPSRLTFRTASIPTKQYHFQLQFLVLFLVSFFKSCFKASSVGVLFSSCQDLTD